MKETEEKEQKMSFKDYFEALATEKSNIIRDEMLKTSGISYPSFYGKLQSGKWKILELKELCRITGESFER